MKEPVDPSIPLDRVPSQSESAGGHFVLELQDRIAELREILAMSTEVALLASYENERNGERTPNKHTKIQMAI